MQCDDAYELCAEEWDGIRDVVVESREQEVLPQRTYPGIAELVRVQGQRWAWEIKGVAAWWSV
jgi:hypothetical protein